MHHFRVRMPLSDDGFTGRVICCTTPAYSDISAPGAELIPAEVDHQHLTFPQQPTAMQAVPTDAINYQTVQRASHLDDIFDFELKQTDISLCIIVELSVMRPLSAPLHI